MTVTFDAMMIPLPEVIVRYNHFLRYLYAHMYFQTGTKFYVSAGIEYSDEAYVWIAQKELTASVTGEVRS